MNVLLEEMSWTDVQEAITSGYDRVLQMIASIEQHGPHLPLGTDTILGYAWAKDIAKALGKVLVAPVIRPGCSIYHEAFPGTISFPEDLVAALIEKSCISLSKSGFDIIILLCSHGGNWPIVHEYINVFNKAVAPQSIVITLPPAVVEAIESEICAFLQNRGIPFARVGVHAGLRETAYMMWVKPELVNYQTMQTGDCNPELWKAIKEAGFPIRKITPTGVLGDPIGANEHLGKQLYNITVKLYVKALKNILANVEKQREGK
ncbi:MAG: creatininase family protein [Candidatus Methanomethyliaceae archaeon]